MPDGNRPDSRRRSPASRPGRAGDASRRRRPAKPAQPSAKATSKPAAKPAAKTSPTTERAGRTLYEHVVEPIKRQAAESLEHRSDQRLGFTARRAAVLAAVVCVLTLTIAGPVRTYFAQRTEMNQLSASQAALRAQISELELKKAKLADPAYIAAQARERLGFVKPGDIPFQVQLPPSAASPTQPGTQSVKPANSDPWYTSLWHTIADAPHLPPANPPDVAPGQPNSPDPAPTPTAPGG